MNELIDSTIKHLLTETVKGNITSEAALKLTQSALNLAHVKQVLVQTKISGN